MSFLKRDDAGWIYPQITARLGTTHSMYAGNTSQQTGAFAVGTTLVRVAISGSHGGHVYFAVGTNPTAVDDTSPAIPTGSVEYFAVNPGEKLAFLNPHGTTVYVSVTEML